MPLEKESFLVFQLLSAVFDFYSLILYQQPRVLFKLKIWSMIPAP